MFRPVSFHQMFTSGLTLFCLALLAAPGVQAQTPTLSGMSISPEAVVGGVAATGTITIPGPAPSTPNGGGLPLGLAIPLSSNNPSVVVPPFAVVREGRTSVTFPITTSRVTSSVNATITATKFGVTKTAALKLKVLAIAKLTLAATSVSQGQPVIATVELNAPGSLNPSGFSFTPSFDSPAAVGPVGSDGNPRPVTVPPNQGSTTFQVLAMPVATSTPVRVSVGGESRPVTITVNPPKLKAADLHVTFFPPTRFPGAPPTFGKGAIAHLVIQLDGEPPPGFPVVVRSDLATVTFQPTNQNPATRIPNPRDTSTKIFLNTPAVKQDTPVTIEVTGGGVGKLVQFVLVPPVPETVLLPGGKVVGGTTLANCKVFLDGKAPEGGLTIPLSSSIPNAVPASVTVAAGQSESAPFSVTPPTVTTATTLTVSSGSKQLGTMTVTLPSVSNLALTPSVVVAGAPVTAVIDLNGPAPDNGFIVPLSSSNPGVVTVPSTPLTIAPGARRGSVPLTTRAGSVTAATTVTITAGPAGAQRTAPVSVQP